jgi:deoxyribonuclease V
MILAVDVDYKANNEAIIAGIIFENWEEKEIIKEVIVKIDNVEEYISGQFYKRELPCILALLERLPKLPDYIIVDGYVYLNDNKKGLGGYLYQSLDEKIPIIGVAKNSFQNISTDTYLYRGESKKPLYITSAGIEQKEAKKLVKSMHGKYRFPTLLKEVDRSCRDKEEDC